MTHFVSITSQGQMSIPISIRRKLGLDTVRKAAVSVEDNKIIVRPVQDISSLRGVFKTNKKVPFKKSRKAFEEYLGSNTEI